MQTMVVRYRYVAPDHVVCRVQHMTNEFARQCVMCSRPVKPEYIVDMPTGRVRYHDQLRVETLASVLFSECAPVHSRCLPLWAEMIAQSSRNTTSAEQFLPILREWGIHSRCYTISRCRWYRRLIDAVRKRQTKKLAYWPLPQERTIPTPRQAVGMIFHQQVHGNAYRDTIFIALRGYDRPDEACVPVHRCSEDDIAQALPFVHFPDQAIFQIFGGLSVRI